MCATISFGLLFAIHSLVPDFCGPTAKPQRMAALTLGCVAEAVEAGFRGSALVLPVTLWGVAPGLALTALPRPGRMIRALSLPRQDGT